MLNLNVELKKQGLVLTKNHYPKNNYYIRLIIY